MTGLSLAFPVWLRWEVNHWVAVPLLTPDLGTAVARDPAGAVRDLERRIARTLEEEDLDESALVWLTHRSPEFDTRRLVLTATVAKRQLELPLLIGTFPAGDHRYVVMPRLGRWFVLPDGTGWEDALQRQLDAALRDRRAADDEWTPPPDAVLRKDRVLPGRVSVRISVPPLSLADAIDVPWFTRLEREAARRAAARELRALAVDLSDRSDLQRTLVPDPRVDVVLAAITADPPIPLALVGPGGSGRTTLVHEAILRMRDQAEADAHQALLDALNRRRSPPDPKPPRRVYHLDPSRIVTGMSAVGEWQRRLERVLGWIRDRRSQTEHQPGGDVVYVDDPVALATVGRSRGSEMVASAILRSWLDRDAFPMVIEATPEQWHRLTELDRPFTERFRVVRVDPPDARTALAIAVRHVALAEDRRPGLAFSTGALQRVIELDARYGGDRGAPGGLVDRLVKVGEASPRPEVDEDAVDAVFRARSGLSELVTDPRRGIGTDELAARISDRLVGQPAAVEALVAVVHAVKSGLRPRGRPIASLLFVGPTGTGKTEAAKVLTGLLFDRADALVRFDMNTFADPGAVHRLIGDLGAGDGLLTSAVRRVPYAVLLLDEIEKAHPAVHDLLLQVLDEGRLTDLEGRTTSFEGCVIVLTSNVGATEAARSMGFDRSAIAVAQTYRAAVDRAFRPELVNRLDRIVAFGGLTRDDLRWVTDLQLERLLGRDGFRNRTVLFDVDDDALAQVAIAGWDGRSGARGLKRVIERELVAAAAAELAASPPDRAVRLSIGAPDGRIVVAVTALRWADQVPPADPPDPDLERRVAAVADALEPLRPTTREVGPGHAELLLLLDDLNALRDALAPEPDPLPDGTGRAVARLSQPTWVAPKTPWKRLPRRVVSAEWSRTGLRSLLIELAEPGAPAPARDEDLAVCEARARAIARAGPTAAWVTLRSAVSTSPAPDALRALVLGELEALALRFGGQLADGRVHGRAAVAALALEQGLHWWIPAAGSPAAIAVQVDEVDPGGPDGDPPAARRFDAILRVYCPPASVLDGGAVHDLRTGDVVRMAGRGAALTRWILAVIR